VCRTRCRICPTLLRRRRGTTASAAVRTSSRNARPQGSRRCMRRTTAMALPRVRRAMRLLSLRPDHEVRSHFPGRRAVAVTTIGNCLTNSRPDNSPFMVWPTRYLHLSQKSAVVVMAQRVQVLLVCDMHEGDTPADESISFALDGSTYEIDLCEQHAGTLREAFAPFVGTARRAGGRTRRRRGSGSSSRAGEIREWARSQGLSVPARGRIPADIAAKYDAAH
jgi:hypothetical protein